MAVNRNRMVTGWNAGAERLLGYRADEMVGRPVTLVVPAAGQPQLSAILQASFAGRDTEAWPLQLIRKEGGLVEVDLTAVPLTDSRHRASGACLIAATRVPTGPDPTVGGFGGLGADELRATFDNAPIGMAILNREGKILRVNRAVSMLLGYTAEELLSLTLERLTNKADLSVELIYVEQVLAGRIRSYRMEKRFVASGGREVWVSLSSTAVGEAPEPEMLLWQMEDLTNWKRTEQDLLHRAFHDPLTDLPNRSLLMDRLSQALARSGRRQSSVAVLFIDLDQFKVINDEFGHDVGDQFLATIASRLRGVTRAHDTVARLGGDEFVMLLEDIEDEETALAIAGRVVRAVSAPVVFEREEAQTTVSVGIAFALPGNDRSETLLERADRAMYRAKSLGGGRYELFSDEHPAPAVRLGGLAQELRHAIDGGQLRLVYQPQIDLETGRIAGVEALVRWEHPERGTLMPADFIPAAERTGLILELGRWVLSEAVRQAVRWARHGPLPVSVNVATQQLVPGDFSDEVANALATSGLPGSSLRLEITESAVLDTVRLAPTWQALDTMGVRLHVDDFGATPSALRHLKGLPVDTVTIHRSSVAGLGTDSPDSAIVEAVVHLAGALNIKSIGEGIETEEQAEALRSLGVTLGQGYFFARPESADVVDELIGRSASRSSPRGPVRGIHPRGHHEP